MDFLSSEVLAGYEPELQTFMLRTSVLERLCAPLCDAVLGRAGSAGALESLARSNLFLVPLDDHRRWFRFHHLFAQILRVELERREPGLVPRAPPPRVRVAQRVRHDRRGDPPCASRRARSREAGQLIAETWVHYANAGRTTSVLDWLSGSPRRSSTPTRGCCSSRRGCWRCAAARTTCARRGARVRALGGLDAGPLPTASHRSRRACRMLSATFAWGDVSAVLEHGTRSAELEGPDSPWRPVVTLGARLGATTATASSTWPSSWLRETIALAPPAEQWIVAVAALADLSLIAGLRGSRPSRLRFGRGGRRPRARARAAGRRRGRRGAHRARRRAGRAGPPRGGAARARAGRLPAPAVGAAARSRRRVDRARAGRRGASAIAARAAELFDEAEAIVAACPDPGVLPERLAAARRAVAVGSRAAAEQS